MDSFRTLSGLPHIDINNITSVLMILPDHPSTETDGVATLAGWVGTLPVADAGLRCTPAVGDDATAGNGLADACAPPSSFSSWFATANTISSVTIGWLGSSKYPLHRQHKPKIAPERAPGFAPDELASYAAPSQKILLLTARRKITTYPLIQNQKKNPPPLSVGLYQDSNLVGAPPTRRTLVLSLSLFPVPCPMPSCDQHNRKHFV
jgi:hypothetical protein